MACHGANPLQHTHRLIAWYCDHFVLPLPEGHRFPMSKYARLRQRLLSDGVLDAGQLREPAPASDDQLRLAHTEDWIVRVSDGTVTPAETRRIGFPWSPEMVERSRRSVGGTIAALRQALIEGVSVNLAGGTHHAFADRGEGFCVFNDVAVAARVAQRDEGVRRVVVIDCDVHQGNGTAAIFRDDASVFTLSLHGARNYPFEKVDGDLDVPLDDGCGDDAYLAALEGALAVARARFDADAAIYLAGADPYRHDRFGRLALTLEGLEARDRIVLGHCRRHGIPVAVVMSGGYAPDIDDIVAIHATTVRLAATMQGGDDMSARYIETDDERWEVRLGGHPPHEGIGTVLFFPRNGQRPYRVIEVPGDRFRDQRQLHDLHDDELIRMFNESDVMDYVHESKAGGRHSTELAQPLPEGVDAREPGRES